MNNNATNQLSAKYNHLKKIIQQYQSVILGFSGGVDSTLLAKVSYDILGKRSLAVIGISPSYPQREREEAIQLAKQIGIPSLLVETQEIFIDGYKSNDGKRCYYCKKELYSKLIKIKNDKQFSEVIDGSNVSDLADTRPGKNAIKELAIKTPLVEANLSKDDVRLLSRQLNLPTWDKASFACLASRIPRGIEITTDSLTLIEKGEQILHQLGFKQFRLRYHQDIARIEILADDFPKILADEIRKKINDNLQQLGFRYITLDLMGYRMGSTSI